MNYFDFHCHLDSEKVAGIREEILHEMKMRNIGACTIGVDARSSATAVALATACSNVWCCIGQHPVDNPREEFQGATYQGLIDAHKDQIVGIGECGLDYYWLGREYEKGVVTQEDLLQEKNRQKMLLRKHITLALANDLPLMLHVRSTEGSIDAHEEALEILDSYANEDPVRAVFHFYTEGPELAQKIIASGYFISFPGVITFGKKVSHVEQAVQVVPLERIFAETDTPYAAPAPFRGKTNQPLYVPQVYHKIAELRGEKIDRVREQILQNVESFFGIKLDRNSEG